MIIGIAFGLGAALSQSLSYIASASFVRDPRRTPGQLLVLSHLWMGVFGAVAALLASFGQDVPAWRVYLVPLISASLAYLVGQGCLFLAMRRADPSRLSPLLGLKLPILALVSIVVFDARFSLLQWGAIVACLVAAQLLREAGGRLPWSSMGWALGACAAYSVSDLNIRALVACFGGLGLVRACFLAAGMSYTVCSLVALCGLPRVRWRDRSAWGHAFRFAVAWFVAMIFLFACFGSIDVVFGNIVQSSRGILSAVIGALVTRLGHVHIERKLSRRSLLARALAALLMFAAIAAFSLGAHRGG